MSDPFYSLALGPFFPYLISVRDAEYWHFQIASNVFQQYGHSCCRFLLNPLNDNIKNNDPIERNNDGFRTLFCYKTDQIVSRSGIKYAFRHLCRSSSTFRHILAKFC